MSDCNRLVRDIHFILWTVIMVVNLIALIYWLVSGGFLLTNVVFVTKLFLYNSIPAYTVILIGFLIVSLLGEQPNLEMYKMFGILGIILFLLTGVFMLVNFFDHDYGGSKATPILVLAILALVNTALFIFDLITNVREAGFC